MYMGYRVIRYTCGIDGKFHLDGARRAFETEEEARAYATTRAIELGQCWMGRTYLAVYRRRKFLAKYHVVQHGAPQIIEAL